MPELHRQTSDIVNEVGQLLNLYFQTLDTNFNQSLYYCL